MNQTKVYLDEFPVNEEGLLLVNDLALIEALRRRAEQRKGAQNTACANDRVHVNTESS